jgi:hypothetical protein
MARQVLGIDKREWSKFWSLTNNKELEQGRHRGIKPIGRRNASETELREARDITRRWIIAFAQTV